MDCGKVTLKYLLFFFNFILWVCGLALIIAGVVVQIGFRDFVAFLGGDGGVLSVPVLLIILGVIIGGVGFFGCCGAIKENFCLMLIFILLLIVVLIAEIGAGIACYIYKDQVSGTLKTELQEGIAKYGQSGSEGLTKGWDKINQEFKCCGISTNQTAGYESWNITGDSVPDSCCVTVAEGCGAGKKADPKDIYQEGCFDQFLDFMRGKIAIIGGASAGIALIEIFGIVLACVYAKKLRTGNYKNI